MLEDTRFEDRCIVCSHKRKHHTLGTGDHFVDRTRCTKVNCSCAGYQDSVAAKGKNAGYGVLMVVIAIVLLIGGGAIINSCSSAIGIDGGSNVPPDCYMVADGHAGHVEC